MDGIQTVVSREVSPLEPRLITVGTIHGGTATNVVPQEAMISGQKVGGSGRRNG